MSDVKSWGEHIDNQETKNESTDIDVKGKIHTAEREFKGKPTNFSKDSEVKKPDEK